MIVSLPLLRLSDTCEVSSSVLRLLWCKWADVGPMSGLYRLQLVRCPCLGTLLAICAPSQICASGDGNHAILHHVTFAHRHPGRCTWVYTHPDPYPHNNLYPHTYNSIYNRAVDARCDRTWRMRSFERCCEHWWINLLPPGFVCAKIYLPCHVNRAYKYALLLIKTNLNLYHICKEL